MLGVARSLEGVEDVAEDEGDAACCLKAVGFRTAGDAEERGQNQQ